MNSHNFLFIFEFIQRAGLIFVDELYGTLDALSRALHFFIDAQSSGTLTLAHFLHQHLSVKQLFMSFIRGSDHQFYSIYNGSWDVLPSVRF